LEIVEDWVTYLREVKVWSNDDPLFPATSVINGISRQSEAPDLPNDWSSQTRISSDVSCIGSFADGESAPELYP
jgi:hypothetical protein